VIRDEQGNPVEILNVCRTIAQRKEAEQQLKESENKFKALVTNNEEIIWMLDKEGTFILSEGKGFAKLGLEPMQVVGVSAFDLYKNFPDILDTIRKALNGETITAEAKVGGNDFRVWYTPHYNLEGEVTGVLGMSVNITEQKQSEKDLFESERRLATLLANLPGMAYRCLNDEAWSMEFVSEGCLNLTGYKSTDLTNNNKIAYANLIHPKDADFVWDEVQKALKEKRPFELEYRIIPANGSLIHVWERGSGIFDGDELLFLEGFITDITERKLAEKALEENLEKINGLYNAMSAGVVFCKAVYDKNKNMSDSIFLDMNQVYEDFTNLKKETAIGKKASEMLPGTEPEWYSTFGEVVKTGKPVSFDMYHEQSQKHYSVFAYNSNKDEFAAVFEDYTERLKADQKINQQNKFLTTVLESLDHPFYVINVNDYTIELANSASGFLPGDKKTCYQLAHHRSKVCNVKEYPCPMEIVVRGKKPVILEHVHFTKDGSEQNIEVHGHPIFDRKGNVVQMIEYSFDITDMPNTPVTSPSKL